MRWRVFIGNKAVDATDVDWTLTDMDENPRCVSGQLQIRSLGGDNLSELLTRAWETPGYLHIQAVGDDETVWPVLDLEDVEFTSLAMASTPNETIYAYDYDYDYDMLGDYDFESFSSSWYDFNEPCYELEYVYEIDFVGYEID